MTKKKQPAGTKGASAPAPRPGEGPKGGARDEVRKSAAPWLMAVRLRVAELRASIRAVREAVGTGGLLPAVLDANARNALWMAIETVDSEVSSLEVLGPMPLPDPVACARGFERDRDLFPVEGPAADANTPP